MNKTVAKNPELAMNDLSIVDKIESSFFNFTLALDDSNWIRRTRDLFQATLIMGSSLILKQTKTVSTH